MIECPCGIDFEVGDTDGAVFDIEESPSASFEPGTPYIASLFKDYNNLVNKPQINSNELIGNKVLQDLFPDGILIDCGDSTRGVNP